MSDKDVSALVMRWLEDVDRSRRNRFQRQVRKFLNCICPDTDDRPCTCIADPAVSQSDLVNAAVLKLLEAAASYDPAKNDSIDAWARTVVENCLVDMLRASTRQRPDGSDYAPKLPGPTGDRISTQSYDEYERYDYDPEDFYRD